MLERLQHQPQHQPQHQLQDQLQRQLQPTNSMFQRQLHSHLRRIALPKLETPHLPSITSTMPWTTSWPTSTAHGFMGYLAERKSKTKISSGVLAGMLIGVFLIILLVSLLWYIRSWSSGHRLISIKQPLWGKDSLQTVHAMLLKQFYHGAKAHAILPTYV
jgi:hypothetical protein